MPDNRVKITITAARPKPQPTPAPEGTRYGPFARDDDDDLQAVPRPTITLSDISTLYSYGNKQTGRAAIGAGAILTNAARQYGGLTSNAGDTYGVDAPDPRIAGSITDANDDLLYFLQVFGVGSSIDNLWADRYSKVTFWSLTGPGYPAAGDPQFGFGAQTGPDYYYIYRTIPSRWPLPAGALAAAYGLTLTAGASFEVGTHARWKARKPKVSSLVSGAAAYLALEEYGYSDKQHQGQIGLPSPGDPAPTIGYAADYWRAGQIQPATLPKQFQLRLTTTGIYFEPFDTADTTNYKVTTEPLFTAAETTLPASTKFNAEVYAMLVPQWWHFNITWDAWAAFGWTSPDHRIGRQIALRPEGVRAVLVNTPGNIENATYRYWMTITTTEAGETWTSLAGQDLVPVTDKTVAGQVDITLPTDIVVGQCTVIARTLYRAIVPVGAPDPDSFVQVAKLVVVISDNETGTYRDNLADASLGALAPRYFPLPFGNSRYGDFFWSATAIDDWSTGAPPPTPMAAGFYWCDTAPGDAWADWTYCSATDPVSGACFPCDLLRARTARVARSLEINGFKQALIRPVFPAESSNYSLSAIVPSFTPAIGEIESGLSFNCAGALFTETEPGVLATDHYESLLIPAAGASAEQIRVLAAWAENSVPYNVFFQGSPSAYETAIVGAGGLAALVDSVDPSFDPLNVDGDSVLDPWHDYWRANGKLTVTRADTPAGSLVAAVSIDGVRRYIWRKTATTGRTAAIVSNAAYDSIDARFTYENLTGVGSPAIPRRFINSSSATPPGSFVFDYTF